MNKRFLAIAIAASLAAPLTVMAGDAEIYGIAHVTVDKISADDGAANSDGWFVTSRASRLGFKGEEDLGGGMKALYKMEFGVNLSDSAASTAQGPSASNITARNQVVGIKGGMGTVLLGRQDTPTKLAQGKFDVFNDTIADISASVAGLTRGDVAGDIRATSSILYSSPVMGGMKMSAMLIPGEARTTGGPACTVASPCDGIADGTSISFTYGNKGNDGKDPIYVGVAIDSGDTMADNIRLAATYNDNGIGVGFLYNTRSDSAFETTDLANDEKALGLSFKYAMGSNAIKAQYIQVTDFGGVSGQDGNSITFGYDMNMTDRTTVYALLNLYSPDVVGGGPSEDETALSAGISHSF